MKKIIISIIILLGSASAFAQQNDKLLQTLKSELNYSMEQLQKQPDHKPYYMSMRVEDKYTLVLKSSFGNKNGEEEGRIRLFSPQIRIGSKQLDNFKYTTQGIQQYQGMSVSQPTMLPLDDNATDGIRAAIWKETNSRYKYACQVFDEAKTKVATTAANEDKAACFSDAPVEKYYDASIDNRFYHIDKADWLKKLNEISAAFKAEPELLGGEASLTYQVSRVYIVNTEGTEVVQNRICGRIMLSTQAVAADGMSLPLNKDYLAYDLDSLPSVEKMVTDAKDMVKRVLALRNAPVADPYTGPAMLSGEASGVFFHEIFGHRLEGHRLKEGGETFKKMVGELVLPKEFQVYCDPTLRHYAGTDLNGYYKYDGEGVKARRVNNVVNGVLKSFLMSRVPLDGFPESNGHGRTSDDKDPVSRQSNLIVETNKPYTEAQMRQMLRAEAKKQGKEYGYYFKTVTSGYTYTGEGGSLNSFNVTPLEVYRIFADGRPDQLVRGVDLIGTPLSMFSHISAAGKNASVFTGVCGAESGWVPVTAVSPTIFVTQIETQRRAKSNYVPATLKAPGFGRKPSTNVFEGTDANNIDKSILYGMKDEMKREMDSLTIAGSPRPFYMSYLATRFKTINVKAELGGLTYCYDMPWDMLGSTQVLVGSFKRNSELKLGQYVQTGIQAGGGYDAIRRAFWTYSDLAYKYNLNSYAQKMNALNSNPLPAAIEKIPDMQRMAPVTVIQPSYDYNIDAQKLSDLACKASETFKDFKDLTNTSVSFEGAYEDTYRVTSENVNLKEPHSYLKIKVSANLRLADGSLQKNGFEMNFTTPEEVPSAEILQAKVREFAEQFVALKDVPILSDTYKGPVMFEDMAAVYPFTENLLTLNKLYAKVILAPNDKALGKKIGKKILDPRIDIVNYTSLPEYNGTKLMGAYSIDADGIKPEAEIPLVEKGILKQILNRATPTEHAMHSTGSARFTNNPRAVALTTSVGTFHVKATGTTDADKMKKELIKLGKKKKLEYVYKITSPAGAESLQLYQINVKTGEEKLARITQAILPTLSQLEKITAISSKENVYNLSKDVNTSVICPSAIILDNIELSSNTPRSEKAPAIPYPLQR